MKNNLMKVVAIVLAIIMCLPISTSAFEEKKEDEEMLMRAEYMKLYILNLDELYELRDFTEDYKDSLRYGDVDSLAKYIGDYAIGNLVDKVFGSSVSTIIDGLKMLFAAARFEEISLLREATEYGLKAIDKAIEGYKSTEEVLNRRVIDVEVEFSVYTNWNYRDVEFIQGGGNIKRVHVSGGWISSGAINALKDKKKVKDK
ncbi:MAG: hypothetical protein ACLVME_06140 [Ezakiella coagulans]|uniref:hypothetical protein n=2 Tax=Ezakiella coagulans TaxID=46507 RepID=UPI00288A8B64|nr:hypothetical protein [Ezakiella coagulans]